MKKNYIKPSILSYDMGACKIMALSTASNTNKRPGHGKPKNVGGFWNTTTETE